MELIRKRLTAVLIVVAVMLLGVKTAAASGDISVFPDKSVIWQVINFVVLIWALNLVLYRPIRSVIKQRKEKIDGLDSNISNSLQEAEAKETAMTEGVKTARVEGVKKKSALVEEAEAEEKAMIEEIHKKTQQSIAENKERISSEAEKVAASLQQEVDRFAAEIGEKILGRKVA